MKEKRRRRPLTGRHGLTVGALALLGLSGYELWIRFEDFWAWTSGIRHLSSVRHTPFLEDLAIVFEAPEMRQLAWKMAFLVVCCGFALICLLRRNRARGAWVLFALALGLAGAGLWLGIYGISGLSQWIKLVPLGLIAAGCATNRVQRRVRRNRRERKEAENEKRPSGTA